MSKLLWVLAMMSLTVGIVHSWDVAMTTGNKIDFYTNDSKTHSIVGQFKNLTESAYDAVHDTLLLVDQQTDNASVYRFNFTSNEFQYLVTRKNIMSIAYDPVKDLLFWLQDRSIFWMQFKLGSEKNINSFVLIDLDDEIPSSIAVDSCEGFIYWTNKNPTKPTIERARFDGSDREVVIDQDIHEPHRLVIDPQIKKMFWIDIRHNDDCFYRIKCADLNGKNRDELLHGSNIPNPLTVSDKSIYFAEKQEKAVWKDSKDNKQKVLYTVGGLYTEMPTSIVAKYTIKEQTQGIQECEALTSLLQNSTVNSVSILIPSDFGSLICVHGEKANDTSVCKCTPGYIGERCDVSVCQNYCIQGNCSVSDDGEPSCRCNSGYYGARCEVDVCFKHCLNNGVCFLNEENDPTCKCVANHEGPRCETVKQNITLFISPLYNMTDEKLTVTDLSTKSSNRPKMTTKLSVQIEVEAN